MKNRDIQILVDNSILLIDDSTFHCVLFGDIIRRFMSAKMWLNIRQCQLTKTLIKEKGK